MGVCFNFVDEDGNKIISQNNSYKEELTDEEHLMQEWDKVPEKEEKITLFDKICNIIFLIACTIVPITVLIMWCIY